MFESFNIAISDNVKFAGLFLILVFIHQGVLKAYWWRRHNKLVFLEPTMAVLLSLLLVVEALLVVANGHIIGGMATVLAALILFVEGKRSWRDLRRRYQYLRQHRDEEKKESFVEKFWKGWNAWWEKYQAWRENSEQRRLVALEKAKLIAQQELESEKEKALEAVPALPEE